MNQKKLNHHTSAGKHPERLSHPALASGRIGHAAEPSDQSPGGFSRTLRNMLLPLAVTVIAGLVSVTVMTALAGNSSDPNAMIPTLSVVALAVSCLVGGITAGLCNRERAVMGGLISGCLLTVLLGIIGLIRGDSAEIWTKYPDAVAWLIRLLPLPIHALGGILTRPRPQKISHTAGNHPARRS